MFPKIYSWFLHHTDTYEWHFMQTLHDVFYFKSQQIAEKTFIAIFAPVIGPFLENYVFKSGFSTACHTKIIGTWNKFGFIMAQ